MSYYDIYRKRLDRYGYDYQSRVQNEREKNFDLYLLKSVYRVDFTYDSISQVGVLEKYKQDETQTLGYLLTKTELVMPNGTMLDIVGMNHNVYTWLILYKENMKASGYNRYIVLNMKNQFEWEDGTTTHSGCFYLVGPGNSKISDTVKSSTGDALYTENDNLYMAITKYEPTIKKGTYFEIAHTGGNTAYKVVDADIDTNPGVGYYSLDPVVIKDHSDGPTEEEIEDGDYYWLSGKDGE